MNKFHLSVVTFGLWLLLCARTAASDDSGAPKPAFGEYEFVINGTKAMLSGDFGYLAQAVRIPKSLFLKSPCQVVYLANPDWATSKVHVDFGSLGTQTTSEGVCQSQAFLTYIDNYGSINAFSGAVKFNDAAWTAVLTAPRLEKDGDPDMPKHLASPPPESDSTGDTSGSTSSPRSRRLNAMAFATPSDRYDFGGKMDYVRDNPMGQYELWVETKGSSRFIPGPGSIVSKPVLASSVLQRFSLNPKNEEPFMDYLVGKLRGDLDPDTQALAGYLSGAAKVYAPALLQECLDIVRLNSMSRPEPNSQNVYVGSSAPLDSCFVTQQVVVIFNNCTSNLTAVPPSRRATATCAQAAAGSGDTLGCLLDAELEKTAGTMGADLEEDFVKVTITYDAYDGCYAQEALQIGQTSTMLILMSAGLMVLFIIFVLSPTLYRLFIEFPIRSIIYGVRKVINNRRGIRRPLQELGLNTHKEPMHCFSCARVPIISQLLWLRKQLVYTICTVHNPDGQFRALQVAVTSVVALLITVVAYPPQVDPAIDYYIPPLTFRIVKWSGDPLMTVWFFLQLLAFSLYLGYVGYMSLLSNYNTPRNKYYWVQSTLSVFWMMWLNALVLAQIIGVLRFWDHLTNRWPWLTMTVFLLGNLGVADVLLAIICFSSNDRHDWQRHRKNEALLREIAKREAEAASARASRKASTKPDADAGGSQGVKGTVIVNASRVSDQDAAPYGNQSKRASPQPPADWHPQADAPPSTVDSPSRAQRSRMAPDALPPSSSLSSQPSSGIGRHRTFPVDVGIGANMRVQPAPPGPIRTSPPGPVAEGVVSGASASAATFANSARRTPYLASENTNEAVSTDDEFGASRTGPVHAAGSNAVYDKDYYDVYGTGADKGISAGMVTPRLSNGGRSTSGRSSDSTSRSGGRRSAAHGKWKVIKAKLKKFFRPLSEDAAFRFPAWFIASLLVAAYVLVFTYAKAVIWAKVIQDCIGDPTDCLNQNLSKYVLFASRIASREEQSKVRDIVVEVLDSRSTVQSSVNAAINGTNSSLLISDPALAGLFNATPVNLTSLQDNITTTLINRLQFNLSSMLTSALGENAALVPSNLTDSLQSQLQTAVADTVRTYTDTIISTAVPAAIAQQTRVLSALNSSLDPFYDAVKQTERYMSIAITVQSQLLDWKDGLHKRFYACSVAGFTLGLLLGLFSLLQIAISFRRASRRIRLARICSRLFASTSWEAAGLDDPAELDDTALPAGDEAAEPSIALTKVAAKAHRNDKGHAWANSDVSALLSDPDSIVNRANHENISFVVYFIGVLMSTAVIQLYVMGVCLTIGLAVVTHPWLWTWLVPRYYMWLVAILIGLFLNKVLLIAFIGGTWLSDGNRIHRPAAWLAFLVIASATNLIIGLLLAVFRIVLLLLTTILTLGQLDVTIFTILPSLDLPHRTFLAGLHLQESMAHFDDPIYLPGPRGRAHRRWRKLRIVVNTVPADELEELLYGKTGRP